jgi:hypothetical protein
MPAKRFRQRGGQLTVKTHYTKRRRPVMEYVNVGGTLDSAVLKSGTSIVHSPNVSVTEVVASSIDDEMLGSSQSNYVDKRKEIGEEWNRIRDNLVGIAKSLEEPVGCICDFCEQPVTSPVRCRDCNSSFIACEDCSIKYHRHLLHKPDIWNVSVKEKSVKYLVMMNFIYVVYYEVDVIYLPLFDVYNSKVKEIIF